MRKSVLTAAGGLAVIALALPSAAAPKATAARFGAPSKLTPANAYGYEPAVYGDRYGNLYATAHKENWQLALGPDSRSPSQTRSMSWAWWSSDHGRTWKDLPAGPGDIYNHNFGDEGDMALDDAGYVYLVDTNVTDITFTAWRASGAGEVAFVHHLPVAIFGEPVDDRPWVTAHGDGKVFYFGNEGNKGEYPGGQGSLGGGGGNANGPGRYTVYTSIDHGRTWDHLGYQLRDSGWCRPAADHTRGSRYVYAVCGNDSTKLYSFVSADDGKTWNRYDMDEYAQSTTDSWPSVEVAKDGSLWASHVSKGDDPGTEVITLYHSTDHGKHWHRQNITPKTGRYVYSWLSVSPDGKHLGLAAYFRADKTQPWKVYGAVWTPGQRPVLRSIDDSHPAAAATESDPPGDLLGSSFDRFGKLTVIWTRIVAGLPDVTGGIAPHNIQRDIYSARQL